MNVDIGNVRDDFAAERTPNQLVERLKSLVDTYEANGETDTDQLASLVSELRNVVAPIGVVYATREQAAVQREIRQLLSKIGQELREFHYEAKLERLTAIFEAARSAVSLWEKRENLPSAPAQNDDSDELLGNILIVGWW